MEPAYFVDINTPPRVIPSSPLEADVLRQIILADRFVFEDEFGSPLGELPIKGGGRLYWDPQWSAELVMHYAVGKHFGGGQFELTVTIYNKHTSSCLGCLQLGTELTLSSVPHPVQGAYDREFWRAQRSIFFVPTWFVLLGVEPSLDLKIKTYENVRRLLAFEDLFRRTREYRDALPHVVLINPERPTAAG
jgi:hypothetical protein